MSATIEAAHFNGWDQEIDQAEGPEADYPLSIVETNESQELSEGLDACREATWWLAESVGLGSGQASALESWIVYGVQPEKGGDLYRARDAIQRLIEAKLEGTVQTEEEKKLEEPHAMLDALLQYRLPVGPYKKTHNLEETRRALEGEFGYDGPVTMLEVVQLQHLAMHTLAEAATEAWNETDEQPADADPNPAVEAPAKAPKPALHDTLAASSDGAGVVEGEVAPVGAETSPSETETEGTNGHAPSKSDGVAESVPTTEYVPDDQHITPPDILNRIGKTVPPSSQNGHITSGAGSSSTRQLVGPRQQWADQAKCQKVEPDTFFPEKGGSTREAKRICSLCEVREECLDFALEHDERFGVWGGLTERERRKLKRMQK